MTADDLDAPLGQGPKKRRISLPINASQALGGALALFFGAFALWAVLAENPFGGEPIAIAPIKAAPAATAVSGPPTVIAGNPNRYDGPDATQPQSNQAAQPPAPAAPGSASQTVTIIDGKTGQRQEIQLAAPASDAPPVAAPGPANQKLAEMTPNGLIPKVAADGMRPADAFAQPAKSLPGKPDAPRIAIIVAGLGVSDSATSDAISKLPGPVTLGFMPYGTEVANQVARARSQGHEVLLQVPMEPFDYPSNDPGPQTLLTTMAPQQNMERLYWLMSRFQGYVGIENAMGARFTSSEQSFTPVLRETAKRGLIFVDDGSNQRSLASRIAGANNTPFAKADVVIDSVATPVEIDRALGRLETAAREHGAVVGVSSALPASIEHIAKWAKGLESRGIVLVPITAVALKSRQT
jgi:polysaccharide deacetylase 2 family uncharacterized protein YibQ